MQDNSEYRSPVTAMPKGRKNRKERVIIKKRTSLQDYDPVYECLHYTNNKKNCRCASNQISPDDLSLFSHHLKGIESKVKQDAFLIKYMKVCYPKRKQKQGLKKPHTTSITYYIRKRNNTLVHVCAQFFKNVTGASTNRLALLARYQLHAMDAPKERRGGSRLTDVDREVTEAIRSHITSFYCRESHYSRGKVKRSYLPPELNLQKMFDLFIVSHTKSNKPGCSLSKYKKIFYTEFNLGFGNPHSDTCSTCKLFDVKLFNLKNNLTELQAERAKKKLHQLRAKKFHSIMNKPLDGTLDIVFDMQQNQPLPKLSVGEVFYSRQVWLYNMGIVNHKKQQSKNDITFYTWLETDGPRGANEVASILFNFLENLEKDIMEQQLSDMPTNLRLFSDSCASQNKNSILMTALVYFLEHNKVFKNITHYFPIRGHSFMPPDRVFGRIEKDFRRKETIISPDEYREILQGHGKVLNMGKDWNAYDYKSVSKRLMKSKMPFKISAARVICYTKAYSGGVKIGVSNTYSGSSIDVEPFKRNISNITNSSPGFSLLPKRNKVSSKKMNDVKKLMQFFVVPECAQQFYDDVLSGNANESTEDIEKHYNEQELLV